MCDLLVQCWLPVSNAWYIHILDQYFHQNMQVYLQETLQERCDILEHKSLLVSCREGTEVNLFLIPLGIEFVVQMEAVRWLKHRKHISKSTGIHENKDFV